VTTLGHGDPELCDAVADQVRSLAHTSNLFYTTPQLEVAQRLVDNSALDRVFFVNSGAEASETCLKIARKWGRTQRDGAYEVITAEHGFHGRTIATTAATGTPAYQEPFAPMPSGFTHVPLNDLDAVDDSISSTTAAVMVELVQGESGVRTADVDYVQGLRRVCDEHGVLLIFDEVQTGIGRTGRLFGYENFGVTPDVIGLAKGLGGGLPIGAVLSSEAVSVLAPGEHGSTFGGSPVACAAARVVLDRVTVLPGMAIGRAGAAPEAAALANIRAAVDAGAAGVAMGRNVFQSDNPTAMTRAVVAVVHAGAGVEEALSILEG